MAIPFSCECGKKLQAKDEFAGRKLKCPNCGRVLTIPRAGPARTPVGAKAEALPRSKRSKTLLSAPKPAPPKMATAPLVNPGFVRFVCSCGRKMKARISDAGSSIACPTCGRALTIPERDTNIPLEPKFGPIPVTAPATSKQLPAPTTSRQLPPPETSRQPLAPPTLAGSRVPAQPMAAADGLFTQCVTSWRDAESRRLNGPEPQEKPVRRLWRPFVVVLLLIGAFAAFWFLAPHDSTSATSTEPRYADLELVPANARSVLTIRVSKFADAKTSKQSPLFAFGQDVNSAIKWSPPDLARITVVTMPPTPRGGQPGLGESPEVLYILRTLRPYVQQDVRRRLLGARDAVRIGKRTMFVDNNQNPAKVLLFVDPHVFVVGTRPAINALLRAPKDKTHALKGALDAALDHDFVMGHSFSHQAVKTRPFQTEVQWIDETYPGDVLNIKIHQEVVFDDPRKAEEMKVVVDAGSKGTAEKVVVVGSQLVTDLHATGLQASRFADNLRVLGNILRLSAPWSVPDQQKQPDQPKKPRK